MKRFVADLHVHSCLSPCAELDMTPARIVKRAVERSIDIVAVSDHNSAENVEAAVRAGKEKGILVIPAMEITSSEEAHVLAFFKDAAQALRMQEAVYESLTEGVNDERLWGVQVVVNEFDEVMGFNERLLIGATKIPLKALVDKIHSLGGLAVASHIDRESFSIVSQLGFIPDDIALDAIEVARRESLDAYPAYPKVLSSDAHRLDDIGRRSTTFFIKELSFEEVASAFRAAEGRTVEYN